MTLDAHDLPARPRSDWVWQDRAVCRDDAEPNRWVDLPPVRIRGRNNPGYDQRLAELGQVCATCPVFAHCLWTSLDTDVRGVFAGTDEYERADLRERLELPEPEAFPPPENETDARLSQQRFMAFRLARQNLTNTEIATALGVSAMTVSRLLDQRDPEPAALAAGHPGAVLAS